MKYYFVVVQHLGEFRTIYIFVVVVSCSAHDLEAFGAVNSAGLDIALLRGIHKRSELTRTCLDVL